MRALSICPTSKSIGDLLEELSTIQWLKRVASGKVFRVLKANKAPSQKIALDTSCRAHLALQLWSWVYFWMNTPSTISIPESNEHCQGSVARDCGHPFSRLVRFWTSKSCQTLLSTFTIAGLRMGSCHLYPTDIQLQYLFAREKKADNLRSASLWTEISLFVCSEKYDISETVFPIV